MTATDDDGVRPRVGRIRSLGGGRAKTYLSRLAERVSRAGGPPRLSSAFGTRGGRGPRRPLSFGRRVIVKARVVRLTPTGVRQQAAHLAYIQRDGVDRDGGAARLYDARGDEADGRAFAERCEGDRHQFRFIVSAEDGRQLASLKPLVRDLMATAERDLGTRLDWVAADHFDTDHPHTHVVLRGKTDRGDDLVIPRDYIAHGLRRRASELVTLELGPETAVELFEKLTKEVDQERFTRLDRRLLAVAEDRVITLDGFEGDSAFFAARLRRLKVLGLAKRESADRWRLDAALEPTLRRMGERGDIVKTMHRALGRVGAARSVGPDAVWSPASADARPLEGRLAALGIADEITDRAYAIVDGVDGRARYVELGGTAPPDARIGNLVRIEPARVARRDVDRTIAAIAAGADGRYDETLHRAHDPRARTEFIRAHVRRLEALRRLGAVERMRDGAWRIPADYADRALDADRARAAREPAQLTVLSREPLDVLATMNAATWLDERLASAGEEGVAETGFGGEARAALAARRLWLVERGLMAAHARDGRLSPEALDELRRRELGRLGDAIWREMRRPYTPARAGERIEGTYVRAEEIAAGKVAVIARARDFTLVPWRDVLERNLGKRVSGVMSVDGVSWDLTRRRGIGR